VNLTHRRENNKQFCRDKRKAERRECERLSCWFSEPLRLDKDRREEMSRAEEWSFLVLVRESSVTLRVSLKRRRRQGRMFLGLFWERERERECVRERQTHRERPREEEGTSWQQHRKSRAGRRCAANWSTNAPDHLRGWLLFLCRRHRETPAASDPSQRWYAQRQQLRWLVF